MKCYELQGPDGVEGLKLVDKPVPQPGEGQVLVRISLPNTGKHFWKTPAP